MWIQRVHAHSGCDGHGIADDPPHGIEPCDEDAPGTAEDQVSRRREAGVVAVGR